MKIPETLSYDDVLLVPQYSEIRSREECDTSTVIGPGVELKIPIISSCMDTVTEAEMASAIARLGGLGVIHRYNTPQRQAQLVKTAVEHAGGGPVAAAAIVSPDPEPAAAYSLPQQPQDPTPGGGPAETYTGP